MSDTIEREHTESFQCCTCEGDPLFNSRQAFRDHMATVHHLTQMKGTKKMVLHLDTARHFISSYECEVEGVKFIMSTNTERENAFRHRKLKAERAK